MNQRNIVMSHKEISRLEVMEQLKAKRLKQREASHILKLSIRQTKRLWSNYKRYGAISLVSKKRGKPSNHQLPKNTKARALQLSVRTLEKWEREERLPEPKSGS